MGWYLIPLVAWISTSVLWAIFLAAAGLGFVIFVHELGHFLAAKACGVKCEKFYVGFDVPMRLGPIELPRALFRRKVGETEYGIGIIPLGGYVKMLGQDDNPANAAKEAERIRTAREEEEFGGSSVGGEIDPRSYPAKTVPQRLLIISAGVIMNLIFAVIFGMVAYRMGVSYTPCVVGSTSPGLSAWEVGLQPGDRIVQLGRDGVPSQHLRFDKDMMVKVMMTGANQDLDLRIQRYTAPDQPASPPEWTTVRLSNPQADLHGRPIIGISPYPTTTVAITDEVRAALAHLAAMQTEPALEQGDEIVAVGGEPVQDYVQLSRQLAAHVDRPVRLTVRRSPDGSGPTTAADELVEINLPVQPMRWLGMGMQIEPISSIQRGSPAEQAGLQIGDRITHVADEPVQNPMVLPHQLRRLSGQEVVLRVTRPGVEQPISIPVKPRAVDSLQLGLGLGDAIGVDALGVAYEIGNRIAFVASGSEAAVAGLEPGDVIEQVEFVAASPDEAELEREIFGRERSIELTQNPHDWAQVEQRIQWSLPKTKVRLSYRRNDVPGTVELQPVTAADWAIADRGLKLVGAEELHQETRWSRAWQLGWRETVESIRQVYFILFRLISGQMSATNLGGPASIATMAGMEAHAGLPRLLVFLTLLSANLAVINFLPIPVLDGGHAMFLLYEGIFRRPVNERVAFGLTMAGLCLILGLMLFVIGLDVWRLSGLAGERRWWSHYA